MTTDLSSFSETTIKKEAFFVDTSLTDYQTLLAGLDPSAEIILVDGTRDGLDQIASWAQLHSGYDAIHILSHGADASIQLGTARINSLSLADASTQARLVQIGGALKAGGDLLLYGCDIAADPAGQSFIEQLASITGADVAASSNATGTALAGGDWVLEQTAGRVESAAIAAPHYGSLLASGTLTYTSQLGGATTVTDGIGGSTDISGITLQISSDTGAAWTYETPYVGSVIAAGYGVNAPSTTIVIKSSSQATDFSFKSIFISDYGTPQTSSPTLKIEGFNNGVSTGSITVNSTANNWENTFSLTSSTAFNIVDEIHITNAPGNVNGSDIWIGLNNVQIGDPVDSTPPTVTDARISISGASGTGGTYKIGDTVTATWDNTAAGDNNTDVASVKVNFSQFGGGSAVVATNSAGTWSASYTISSGSIDTANRNISVTATDTSGNASTIADTANATVDNIAPTVTDAKISISGASGTGGAFKVGDTVTATWNNTAGGDNNADTISRVTVDFSQFGGGSAVAATNSSGTWTATYTIASGAIDTTNRNVSFSATDNAGNSKTTADTSNATVDSVPPVVTDAQISISGGTGTGGTYKIGDTVTATWNNTAVGDDNSDAISSVQVNFSQFGASLPVNATNSSGTWTASYTIVAGSIDGLSNRNVSVGVTDNAGNNTTVADTTNGAVDNAAPAVTFSGVSLSSDTGTSNSDFITGTAAQTITATLSGAIGAGDIVYGSLDNGATWTDVTAKVSGTALAWNGVTLSGSGTLKLKVADAAGNDGAVTAQSYVLDTTGPAAPSAPDLSSGTDSGSSSSDDITNNTTPTFSGTAESGSTVTLYDTDGTTVLGTGTATGGNWSITSATLSAGSHTLTAKATDIAGNVSGASSGLAVTVDTAAPTGLGASATTIATTNAASSATLATLSATDSQAITYSLAAGNGTNDADNGSFAVSGSSLKVGASSLTAGTYHIYLAATDAAGNVAYQPLTLTIVDAPSVASIVRSGGASSTASTAAASLSYTVTFNEAVTGVDASDFALSATGTASGSIASVSGSGTTYTVTVDSLSGDGTLRLDLNGSGTGIRNGSSINIASGYTSGSGYTLDHTAPNAPAAPDMSSGTDTGSSSTDNITSSTTPTFTGTAESGSTVTLYDTDGTTVLGTGTATGGNWSITSATLSAGSHTLTAKATDAAGNVSGASSGLALTVDTAAPTGIGVSATTIATTNAASSATLATLSATDSQAITYSLAAGNGTNDADNGSFAVSGSSLKVGASSLTTGTYHIYLAATDAAGNVSNQAFTLTIADAPSVASIVRSGGATSTVNTAAASLSYTVTFNEAVTGVDASDFALSATGTASGSIASVSGSGTTYTVTVDSLSGDGTLRLDLNGSGTGIRNGSSINIASGYTSGSGYTLDHTAPNAPAAPDMSSGTDTGSSSTDNITSSTTPTFTGTAESGSTVTLYDTDGTTVLGTGTATGGNWSITSSTLSAGDHTLTAQATDPAGNQSSASSGLALTVDIAAPAVTAVAVPADGAYRTCQTLQLTVSTGEPVTVDTTGGTPHIALIIGATTVYADYASGSGSNALVFSYTLQAGQTDVDGITIGALSANGGTLKDTAGNVMALALNGVATTAAVLVDTSAPSVDSVSVPANGTYYLGDALDFSVNLSEQVTVDTTGGTPRIAITLDTGGTVYADYLSGSGTNTLVFRHIVADGEVDATGITLGALSGNGGTLRDGAGNNAGVTLNSVSSTAAVTVDASAPHVSAVSSATANGSYPVGATVTVSVDFTKAVTVDTTGGAPTLALGNGGTATYASGSGSATLVFTYTVGAGQDSADLDYAASAALSLNGATIKDSASAHRDAVLTLATPGASGSLGANKAIVIDTVAPAVTFSGVTLSSDTGASASDFITSTTAQTIGATLSGALGAGELLYGSADNGAHWTDITGMVTGTTLAWTGATLDGGASAVLLQVRDAAGNQGAVSTTHYTVDTSAPVLQGGTVSGITVELSYASPGGLDAANAPLASAFTVTSGGSAIAVSAVAVNAATSTISLTLAQAVAPGDTIMLAYADPTGGNDANVIQDIAGNDAATFSRTLSAPQGNPPPVPVSHTIDGVTVQTQTTTNADGSTTQSLAIPIVQAGRPEQIGNNNVADIPLVSGTGGNTLLLAQLPTGFGLQASGPAAPLNASAASTTLMQAIQAHTSSGSADQGALTGGGAGFLSGLAANAPLLVRTIVPTMGPGTLPGQPLVISGQVQDAGTALSALVIDGSGLPGGTSIQLQNVEFAAIIGALKVTGGDGSQTVWGDSADQYIVLGADDDILHGGGGNDTVGSAGGNDQIFGDAGDDTVFGGTGNDFIDGGTGYDTLLLSGTGRSDYSMRVQNGQLTVTHNHGGSDGTDTVTNVEAVRFTGAVADTSTQGTIMRLYEVLLGRAPDTAGMAVWTEAVQHGLGTAQAAASMLASDEALQQQRSNADFVDMLYQRALGRTGQASERAFWVAKLDAGTADRSQVLLAFADSTEKKQIDASTAVYDFNQSDVATLVRLYDALLERRPDEAGLNLWIAQHETGMSLHAIADAFLGNSEALQLHGKLNNHDFVDMLYESALHRAATAAELASWTSALDAGTIDRGIVLLGIADSAEHMALMGPVTTSIVTH